MFLPVPLLIFNVDVDDWHFSRLILLLAEDLDLRCGFEISLRRDLIEHSLCIVGSECGVGANRT